MKKGGICISLAAVLSIFIASCSSAAAEEHTADENAADEPAKAGAPAADENAADEAAADENAADEAADDEDEAENAPSDSADEEESEGAAASDTITGGDRDPNAVPRPREPFTIEEDIWPCTECHDEPDDFNLKRRKLRNKHDHVKLDHGPSDRWCYDCHNPSNRDRLRLASGKLVPFKESHRLCGQCHSTILRYWREGIHGKRTGSWNGKKEYHLCVHCHRPHQPRFKRLEPKPRPRRPSEIKG